jgi:hypothetical protein
MRVVRHKEALSIVYNELPHLNNVVHGVVAGLDTAPARVMLMPRGTTCPVVGMLYMVLARVTGR